SFVIVFLLFAPQLAALASDRNRYFLFWDRLDTLAACASIAVLALLGVGIGGAGGLGGAHWAPGLCDPTLGAVFALGVLANLLPLLHVRHAFDFLKEHRGPAVLVMRVGLLAALACWGLLLVYRRALLPRVVRTACLILSPIIPIVVLPALFWST